MANVENRTQLLAYCGLYCGNCGSYKKGRCKGCKMDGGFSSCKVRKCCLERDYVSCAECDEYLNCKKLNNLISKIFGFIFRSNRKANIMAIKEIGIEKWVDGMAASGKK